MHSAGAPEDCRCDQSGRIIDAEPLDHFVVPEVAVLLGVQSSYTPIPMRHSVHTGASLPMRHSVHTGA